MQVLHTYIPPSQEVSKELYVNSSYIFLLHRTVANKEMQRRKSWRDLKKLTKVVWERTLPPGKYIVSFYFSLYII